MHSLVEQLDVGADFGVVLRADLLHRFRHGAYHLGERARAVTVIGKPRLALDLAEKRVLWLL